MLRFRSQLLQTTAVRAQFSSTSTPSSRKTRRFDPNKIIPSEFGKVRIISNTTRDAQQSNLSAEMADVHRQKIATMIDECYAPMKTFPGYEQTWGGTVPMFDIWKRGVHPFEEMRQMAAVMPNTPASALIRSNGLNSMSNQPKDVVEAFIEQAYDAGVDVFTNFCAHNDYRNHEYVAEAVHRVGGHYQAALSWAVWHSDPTIYNVEWAVDFFRQVMPFEPHSLYIKDPSGVLTPEMAGLLAKAVKTAFPDKPLVFHAHYQTGFAYMSYLQAMLNGANGVECSLGFADGAGQPYTLSMLRAIEDFGMDVGNPNRAAMLKINQYCKSIQNLYKQGRVVRTPDVAVEQTGIAGGQRSILDKELQDAGQAHLIPEVDTVVQTVRSEGGKVCQVTPVADSYAREAMRRLRGGAPLGPFAPGYASILTGEGGLVKEPVDCIQQNAALNLKGLAFIKQLFENGVLSPAGYASFTNNNNAQFLEMRRFMDSVVRPVAARARLQEVESRIVQLQRMEGKPAGDSLQRKLLALGGSLKKSLDTLSKEAAQIKSSFTPTDLSDVTYETLLRGSPSDELYGKFVASSPLCAASLQAGHVTAEVLKQALSQSGLVTCMHASLLAPGIPSALKQVTELSNAHNLNLVSTPLDTKDNATLMACYRQAAIPNLINNFFKNYKTNPAFWPRLFDEPAPVAASFKLNSTNVDSLALSMAVAGLMAQHNHAASLADPDPWVAPNAWRSGLTSTRSGAFNTAAGEKLAYSASFASAREVTITAGPFSHKVTLKSAKHSETATGGQQFSLSLKLDKHDVACVVEVEGKNVFVITSDGTKTQLLIPTLSFKDTSAGVTKAVSHINGTVFKVNVKPGDAVKKGDILVVVEAMKMEHAIRAPGDAVVDKVFATKGAFAEGGKVLVSFVVEAKPAKKA